MQQNKSPFPSPGTETLTAQELAFCAAYARIGQALPALVDAGIPTSDIVQADRKARELLRRPEIKACVAEHNTATMARNLDKADALIERMATLAEVDIGQVLSWDNGVVRLRDLELLPPHVRAAIQEVSVDKNGNPKVKLVPKTELFANLGRAAGLFRNETTLTLLPDGTQLDPQVLATAAKSIIQRLAAQANPALTQKAPAPALEAPSLAKDMEDL